jgi:hypothetical protein
MHLREDVHLDHGVKIDYLVAARAKILAKRLMGLISTALHILGQLKLTILITTRSCEFLSPFVSYASSIAGYPYCRSLLTLDGTHLKTRYQGVLLIAVGVDAEQHLFPLAFGVVNAENRENGSWFLEELRTSLEHSVNIKR